jgi:hypothetical protein
MAFNSAIDHVIQNNPKVRQNPMRSSNEIADRIKLSAKAYPQIRATSETSDTPGVHPGEGRAARTVALQSLATAD